MGIAEEWSQKTNAKTKKKFTFFEKLWILLLESFVEKTKIFILAKILYFGKLRGKRRMAEKMKPKSIENKKIADKWKTSWKRKQTNKFMFRIIMKNAIKIWAFCLAQNAGKMFIMEIHISFLYVQL